MYTLDYYGGYNIEAAYENGIDVGNMERSLIRLLLPDAIADPVFRMMVPDWTPRSWHRLH